MTLSGKYYFQVKKISRETKTRMKIDSKVEKKPIHIKHCRLGAISHSF
jgi:hypothetical protein